MSMQQIVVSVYASKCSMTCDSDPLKIHHSCVWIWQALYIYFWQPLSHKKGGKNLCYFGQIMMEVEYREALILTATVKLRRISKLPNGTMEYRRISTLASHRSTTMEKGRNHLFSMEDGRIPFLATNLISVLYTCNTRYLQQSYFRFRIESCHTSLSH